jgi:23S rRNA pseudouridine1911/1915/1917 synthase
MIYSVKENTTILDFICEINKGMSRQGAKNVIKYSTVICDGKKINAIPSTTLQKGQKIEFVKKGDNQQNKHPNKENPFVIKYEDDDLIVAIKPVGLLTSKDSFQKGVSFFKVLEKFLSERDKRRTFLWVVHRLDREVEGLVIFAKTEDVQQKFQENWTNVIKKYICLTENKPEKETGFIESWLKDAKDQTVIVYSKEVQDSKFAKTEYKYLKTYGNYHLLEVKLHTGRKNQIRAHLSSINCPIVGDRKYGADGSYIRQIRLVSYFLEFVHPITNKLITIEYKPKPQFYKPLENEDEKYKTIFNFEE